MLEPEVPLEDPCPCGSGRRYKNCCWRRLKREHAAFRAALDKAREDLFDLMWKEREDDFFDLVDFVLEPLRMRQGPELADDILGEVDEIILPAIADMLISDDRGKDGRSFVDEYLARRGDGLRPEAVEFLESWRDANVSLFEVREVVSHSHVVLKDLLSNRLHRVADVRLSETLSAWDTLFARIVSARGHDFFSSTLLPFSRQMLEVMRRSLEKYRSEYGNRSLSWKRLLKRDWWLIPEIWLELAEQAIAGPGPEMVNSDGDPVESVAVTYHLQEGTGMMAAALLEKIPEVSREPGGEMVWLEEREEGSLENVLVASITHPDESTLVVHTNSRNREERVGAVIEEWLGSMIDDVDVEYRPYNPEDMAPSSGMDPEDLSPEELAELQGEVLRKVYGRWPDQHLPALDGMTPREAVEDPAMRRKVISLLKDMESGHQADGSRPDLGWLWKELGLKRP